MTVIQFISQYILLLFYSIIVTVNFVTVIPFISQYLQFLLNYEYICVTVNFVTVIQFSSQYILLLLVCIGVTVNCVTFSVQFSIQILISLSTFSGTYLHAFRPPFCFHKRTECNFILYMVNTDSVWFTTLITFPLCKHRKILSRPPSVSY